MTIYGRPSEPRKKRGRGAGVDHATTAFQNVIQHSTVQYSIVYIKKREGYGPLFWTKDDEIASSLAVEVKHRDDTEYKDCHSKNALGKAATALFVF